MSQVTSIASRMCLQSLARLGGSVTGIDASREAICAAQLHMQADSSLQQRLQYQQGTADELLARGMPMQEQRSSMPGGGMTGVLHHSI